MEIDLPEKRYYKIGEVAKAFNVNTSLVRFWEKEFEIIKPKKMQKGTVYSQLLIFQILNSSIILLKKEALLWRELNKN
jgi:DNA-binding transcriptional MerR regulator